MAVKKVSQVLKQCVACGSCIKECPLRALSIYKGLYAKVDGNLCVGCGKCVAICPAQSIELRSREEVVHV